MRDLCQTCKNFSTCVHGEGSEFNPNKRGKVEFKELISDKGEHSRYLEVVVCDLYNED